MIFTAKLSILLIFHAVACQETVNGRYTQSIKKFKFVVPHRKTATGHFHSFNLPNFFEFEESKQFRRRKRSLDDPRDNADSIHYGIDLNDDSYHIELWPNHDFLSPNLVFENFDRDTKVQDKKLRTLKDRKLCHYVGKLRGEKNSRAAISTCDGLTGHIIKDGKIYYIEPVDKHAPNSNGHHLHVLFEEENVQEPARSGTSCGVTNEKWLEGWKSSLKNQMLHGGVKQKRGSVSVYRYIETLAVCDKKFLTHHKSRDVENYLLTLMNMLFDLYHDVSVGAQIDVITLRVIYLEKEDKEINLKINADASASLDSFCLWQQHLNTNNGEPNHHDVAMLFTRHDLCDVENDNNCGLVGLAYVSEVCTQEKHCSINEDTGLMVAITATHELGHLLGCNHDEQGESPCAGTDPEDGSTYVMHPSGTFFSYKWSTCSRGFMNSLFESNLGECLNNEPKPTLYPYKQALPGVVYNANEQCHLLMPETQESCDMDNIEFCDQLWCKKGSQCVGDGNGPADGTKCGENKWCFRKKCVETGERPKSVDGGWGDWGEFSPCSRTCGGGVSSAERFCDHPIPENRGLYCLGERKKIKICNTEPCPQGAPSFRHVQCVAWNNKEYNGVRHTWEVYNGKIDKEPCSLYCLHEKHSYSKLGDAQDGTPCKMGTKYMCIQGDCKKVGCDWEVNSDAVEDICGVCNGDGTQCRIIDEVNNEVLGNGYQKIAIIPAGARNVLIEELKPSKNIIAIADRTEKKFYLNANNMEHNDGPYKFGKVEGVYSHTQPKQEKLVIHGPLLEDLVFMVAFYKHENVGYRYKYAEMTPDSSYTPSYHWELTEYGSCSSQCGGGTKAAQFNCIESKAGKVSANFCTGIDKPNGETQVCNEQPCKTEWRTGKWGPCRACKNHGGVRTRDVECIKDNPKPGGDVILVEDDQCPGPKPGTQELCETKEVCGDKEKRSIPGVSDKYLKDIWSQMNRKSLNPDRHDTHIPDAHVVDSPKKSTNDDELNRQKRNKKEDLTDKNFVKFLPYSDEAFQAFDDFYGYESQSLKESDSDRLKRNQEKLRERVTLNSVSEKIASLNADDSNSKRRKRSQINQSHRQQLRQRKRKNSVDLKPAEHQIINAHDLRAIEHQDFVKFGPFSDEAFQLLDEFANIDGNENLNNLRIKRERSTNTDIATQSDEIINFPSTPDNTVQILNNFAAVEYTNRRRKKRSKGFMNSNRESNNEYDDISDNLLVNNEMKIDHSKIQAKVLENEESLRTNGKNAKETQSFIKLHPISDEAYQVLDEDFFVGNNYFDLDSDRMKRAEEIGGALNDDSESKKFHKASEKIYQVTEDNESIPREDFNVQRQKRMEKSSATTPCRKMSFLFETEDESESASTSEGVESMTSTDRGFSVSTTVSTTEDDSNSVLESVMKDMCPNRKNDSSSLGSNVTVHNSQKGKVVVDKTPIGQKKLMIVDLKNPHPKNKNISDKVFQTMGDDVKKDVVDRAHQRNLTGEDAVKELVKLQKDETTSTSTTSTTEEA